MQNALLLLLLLWLIWKSCSNIFHLKSLFVLEMEDSCWRNLKKFYPLGELNGRIRQKLKKRKIKKIIKEWKKLQVEYELIKSKYFMYVGYNYGAEI